MIFYRNVSNEKILDLHDVNLFLFEIIFFRNTKGVSENKIKARLHHDSLSMIAYYFKSGHISNYWKIMLDKQFDFSAVMILNLVEIELL